MMPISENGQAPALGPISADLEKIGEEKWQAFSLALGEAGRVVPNHPAFCPVLSRAFLFSDFVHTTCLRHPDLAIELFETDDLFRAYGPKAYAGIIGSALAGTANADELGSRLRQIRRREMIRLICRDLCGMADLEETMGSLSSLAEACLDRAVEKLHSWHTRTWGTPRSADGTPQRLVVLGMGKLGARELNLSSDIDLLFAYPESGGTDGSGKSTTNEDFFTRIGRALLRVMGAATHEGFVFRMDMRLRPYGENGPLVMSFDAMEDYYQNQGREWERYAWIKARVVAGDHTAGHRLMTRLAPFVYRRYLDYGVFDALRGMKKKIAQEIKRKKFKPNIKLGPGGIREIEFFGQVFQLMRGGVVPALRQRRIQKVLDMLVDENFIETGVRDQLQQAYIFLRNTEHRLQAWGDQQTHDLPGDTIRRQCLAAAMGFAAAPAFFSALNRHRARVHEHFKGLLAADAPPPEKEEDRLESALEEIWQDGENARRDNTLAKLGFDDPPGVFRTLSLLRSDAATRALSREGRDRLDRLMPRILRAVKDSERPDVALIRILDLIRAIQRRTNYLALLLENTVALTHLIRFADISPWIIAFLSRHPVLLDELLDHRTLFVPPDRKALAAEIQRRQSQIDPSDLEYQMEEICIFKQINILRVAAADITGALPLMRTSDHLTDIAETVVAGVLDLAWTHLVEKHGRPKCRLVDAECSRGFAVIAYGKLGGIELGYGSDLDLVFLHAGTQDETTGSRRPMDSVQFFSRLGQRVVHILTAHTRAGKLYETDMRLRPSGSGGILVSHINAFADYQAGEAWTWEHQALVRARPIAGDPVLMARFEQIRKDILSCRRDPETLKQDVAGMRRKMRRELFKPVDGFFDLKQGNGGMVDIEFIVQYLVLRHAAEYPELTRWSDNVRQIEALRESGAIDEKTAELLHQAYLGYRAAAHRLNLQDKPGRVEIDHFGDMPQQISNTWKTIFP
jgi:[glutamine synthetase] adenylyltransferase / [glutamine synthetase]-adenylyl-L-tyrosine phosphorylase